MVCIIIFKLAIIYFHYYTAGINCKLFCLFNPEMLHPKPQCMHLAFHKLHYSCCTIFLLFQPCPYECRSFFTYGSICHNSLRKNDVTIVIGNQVHFQMVFLFEQVACTEIYLVLTIFAIYINFRLPCLSQLHYS